METTELISEIGEFYDLNPKILTSTTLSKGYVLIDFKNITQFNQDIAHQLLDDFEGTVECFRLAIKDRDLYPIKIRPRFFNIPKSEYKKVWKIRSEDVEKFVVIKGFLRKVSDVMHSISESKYECPSCGNVVSVLQFDKIKEPAYCGCGRKGGFRLLDRNIFDLQKVVLEEDPMELGPTQKPRRLLILLKNDLCREEIDSTLQPSKKVQICGVIKDKLLKGLTNEFTKFMEANWIEVVDESFESLQFSKSEREEFKKISETKTLFEDMAQSIIPTIYGHGLVKQAIFLQLVGGIHLYNEDKSVLEERGTIHILLVGSPGSGKSQMLKRAVQFIPNSRFTGGRGTSGVGLVAAVVKDEELGGYTLDAGAVPMCNKSMCAVDELDKIDKRDIAMMNNAMNDLKVSIDKANIHGILETDTMILGAANPKDRVFDKREVVWKQIGLPKDFMDRFDLIFPVEPMQTEKAQRKVATVIFSKYRDSEKTKPKYDKDKVMRYIAYARKKYKPTIDEDIEECITTNFINLVKPKSIEEDQAYFSSRLLTNIIRLSTACAKARLSNEVNIEDAKRAINILIDSLKKQDIISSHGLLDIEKMEAVIPKPKRDKMYAIRVLIKDLSEKAEDGLANFDDIIKGSNQLGIEEPLAVDILEKLHREGEVFEPKSNKYKLM